ncbi:peptidoglycan-binding protein [Dyella sp. EPa41]|uniref:chitosanase n=1 Tax=Dyella sp. EPa41 TaxID=1561194 RepID=UPI001914F29F|nr:peptidoglycan-binding protein [Dyella sp. EPa41]
MITATQKRAAEAIVNIFETGSVRGDYSNVTLIAGDTGHLTFGRSQTTLSSGNLATLVQRYCANAAARFASALNAYIQPLVDCDVGLDDDKYLHNVLRATADDPVMRDTQDQFFDDVYWAPAQRAAAKLGIALPLGMAVVYDSTVHGSWPRLRDSTTQQAGDIQALGEKAWISAYVDIRRAWLANNSNSALRPTVYRMDALKRLIELGQWGLELPLVVRGFEISVATMNATPAGCFDGPASGSRSLSLATPLVRGMDVRLVQLNLSRDQPDIKADGIFGRGTADGIKAYQARNQLPATGVADTALIAKLIA